MRSWLLQVDEDKEARKLEAARAVLAGRSFTEGEEDPFEGLGPQEIQAYIDKALDGVSHSDPFEVRPSAVAIYAVTSNVFGALALWQTNTRACTHNFIINCVIVCLCSTYLVCLHVTCNHDTNSGGSDSGCCKLFLVQGLTPEEINDYTAKNGVPAQYQ